MSALPHLGMAQKADLVRMNTTGNSTFGATGAFPPSIRVTVTFGALRQHAIGTARAPGLQRKRAKHLQCSHGRGASSFDAKLFKYLLHVLFDGGLGDTENCGNV